MTKQVPVNEQEQIAPDLNPELQEMGQEEGAEGSVEIQKGMTNKKILRWIIGIIVVVGVIIAAALYYLPGNEIEEGYVGPLEKVTVAVFKGDITALVYYAKEEGLFEKNGLEVVFKEFDGGNQAAEEMLSSEADISTSSSSVLTSKSFTNSDVRTIGTISTFEHLELVARRDSEISVVKDIVGKKIGVTKGSSGEFFFGTFLSFNGLTLDQVEIVDLSPTEIVSSIGQGTIDASFTWEPHTYNIKELLGDNAISWTGQSGQKGNFLLLTTQTWIDQNPQVTERYLTSLVEAEELANENPEEFKLFTKQLFEYSEEYIEYVWPRNEFIISLSQRLIVSLEDQARWRIENNLTDATEVPNFLNYIYIDALELVKPSAMTIIK
jgi:ABC-type nitrate/sulfonate/bicarbonate transport system substrate-binding protein